MPTFEQQINKTGTWCRCIPMWLGPVLCGVFLCSILCPAIVAAQQKHSEVAPEAIEFYRQAIEHYQAGRLREAMTDLESALLWDPNSPSLIYNVAKVSELLGNLDESIDYYERYLRLLPGSEQEERERIRATLKRLRKSRSDVVLESKQESVVLKPPEPVQEEETLADGNSAIEEQPSLSTIASEIEQPSEDNDTIYWVGFGTSFALVAGGAVLGALALDSRKQFSEFVVGPDGSAQTREAIADEARTYALMTDICVGTGLVGLAVTALFYLLDESDDEPDADQLSSTITTNGQSTLVQIRGAL